MLKEAQSVWMWIRYRAFDVLRTAVTTAKQMWVLEGMWGRIEMGTWRQPEVRIRGQLELGMWGSDRAVDVGSDRAGNVGTARTEDRGPAGAGDMGTAGARHEPALCHQHFISCSWLNCRAKNRASWFWSENVFLNRNPPLPRNAFVVWHELSTSVCW